MNAQNLALLNSFMSVQRVFISKVFFVILVSGVSISLQSQSTCQNLVVNGDFSFGDNFFTSDLFSSCNNMSCDQGAYCVGDNFQDKCYLWPNSGDHTGGGDFLVIDGEPFGSGVFDVWKTAAPITVVPGKAYEFSFWVQSVYEPALQYFTLEMAIEDYSTGNSLSSQTIVINQAPFTWTKFSLAWTCPANVTGANLVIRQLSTGLYRDFGIDDISFCTTCCDDFVNSFSNTGFTYDSFSGQFCLPQGLIFSDILEWDFGDGNSATTPVAPNCFSYSYNAPGSYLASLCIQRPLANGDTCKVTLCQLVEVQVTCTDCEAFLAPLTVSAVTDITAWTAPSGTVTFYPFPVLTPYNIRILWDFDGDGFVDATTYGNDPVSYNFPCGFHTVYYTVECRLSQQVACYSKSFETSFNIACPDEEPVNCCEDFMTDVMDFGIIASGIMGNTYSFCLSGNLTASDMVVWDINCDGIADGGNAVCETFTISPGDFEICATVWRVTPEGDTCRVKVNACLPETEPMEECLCDNLEDDVNNGFTWSETSPFEITFTPGSLTQECDSISWSWGDGTFTGPLGPSATTHVFPSMGSYLVCMIVTREDATGTICTYEYCATILVEGTVAVGDADDETKWSLFPNPANDEVNVSVSVGYAAQGNMLYLRNIQGQVVLENPVLSEEVQLNVGALPGGVYFLSISDTERRRLSEPKKLIIY